eukprot:EG_transcript_22327
MPRVFLSPDDLPGIDPAGYSFGALTGQWCGDAAVVLDVLPAPEAASGPEEGTASLLQSVPRLEGALPGGVRVVGLWHTNGGVLADAAAVLADAVRRLAAQRTATAPAGLSPSNTPLALFIPVTGDLQCWTLPDMAPALRCCEALQILPRRPDCHAFRAVCPCDCRVLLPAPHWDVPAAAGTIAARAAEQFAARLAKSRFLTPAGQLLEGPLPAPDPQPTTLTVLCPLADPPGIHRGGESANCASGVADFSVSGTLASCVHLSVLPDLSWSAADVA